jgi:hypothetical protein
MVQARYWVTFFAVRLVQAGVFALRARLVFDGKKLVVNIKCLCSKKGYPN